MQAESIEQEEQSVSVWRTLVEAIKGTHQDFTNISISKAVFLLAIPMVLEMLLESLFGVVDIFWVTRLGSNAVVTVGLTESMLTLVFSIALGLSFSTTAMVARRVGEKDLEGAAIAATQAILLGVGVALAVGIPALLFTHQLLSLMGGDPALVAVGHRYTEIVFGGTTVVMLLFLNNAIFRGAGDASIAMRVLWVSNLINLMLDPCFIFGLGFFPKMGVTGAAVATLIGRSCGVLFQFWMLTNGKARIQLLARHVRIVPKVIGTLIRVSSTGMVQFLISHTSWLVLVRIISQFWKHGGGGLHDWHTHLHVHHSALVGDEWCGGDDGWAESRGEEARAGGTSGLGDGGLQRDLPGGRGDGADFCAASGGGAVRA